MKPSEKLKWQISEFERAAKAYAHYPHKTDYQIADLIATRQALCDAIDSLQADDIQADAARFRKLAALAKEDLLRPEAAFNEICADRRTHWRLPVLICSGPIGGYKTFAEAVDALPEPPK